MSDDDLIRDFNARDGWFIPASAISALAAQSLDELIRRSMHGGSADLILRVDARESRWQADWIKYMRRAPKP